MWKGNECKVTAKGGRAPYSGGTELGAQGVECMTGL